MRPLFIVPYPKHRILPADSGDEVVPNPTVAFALEQRVLNSFLDTLGATSALNQGSNQGGDAPEDNLNSPLAQLVGCIE